ncbi:hypothetical protein PGTUg99_014976 [Puccinia graminis f. sp. tritici]|uniref:Uncharacterized protein n=1 Tax=Puccinia graminis f. sp. tritici TaxID=56615 RepID=A0A5B0SB90_PUCGR|nr:hypothetical protein PGTUg99_014976 [Puccinia graminis f. sp. tritici]
MLNSLEIYPWLTPPEQPSQSLCWEPNAKVIDFWQTGWAMQSGANLPEPSPEDDVDEVPLYPVAKQNARYNGTTTYDRPMVTTPVKIAYCR